MLESYSLRQILRFFDHEGGPVWDSNVFLKSVTYRPTLGKFRGGGPVKKNTLYNVSTGNQINLKHVMMRANHNPSEALLLAMAWAPAGLFGLQFLEKNFRFDFLP